MNSSCLRQNRDNPTRLTPAQNNTTQLEHPMRTHRASSMKKKTSSLRMMFVKDAPDPGNITFTSRSGRFPDSPQKNRLPVPFLKP